MRASDVIDALTHFQLVDAIADDYKAFGDQRTFIQGQIQKATATLVEHWIILGGYDAMKQQEGVDQVYIGDLRLIQTANANSIEKIPESVIGMINSTGLLYAGIHSGFDHGLYFTSWWL